MKYFLFSILSFITLKAMAQSCENKGPNVILFTWDGVRNKEFFEGTDFFHRRKIPLLERGRILKKFWSTHAKDGVVLGEKENYQIASSVAISLPSYQAIMTGHATDCRNNHCGTVKEETVLEKVKRKLNLNPSEVAAFASWEGMMSSVAMDSTQITRAIYPEIREDELFDKEMIRIQQKAMGDLPIWKESRKDEYTFRLGMDYLKKNCPRLLYISLVDSDEYGHADDYKGYVNSIKTYDKYLDQVIQTIDSMGEYGKQTTLIVTTDHSRGDKRKWTSHGYDDVSNKNVFLYMRGRGVQTTKNKKLGGHHGLIRPTIEYLMGVESPAEVLPGINLDVRK
jgi:membrane-anchored protein YejM (alkaline phosphatase superfamily)